MSAKKKEKSEWKLCVSCGRYFPRSVCTRHEKQCGIDNVDQLRTGNAQLPSEEFSGYIQDGELHGICKRIEQISDLPTTKNDLVIIHPSAIKLCHFQITSSVVIEYNGRRTCGTVWHSTSIPVDGIGLKSAKIETLKSTEGDIMQVSMLNCPSIIADKIVVEAQGQKSSSCFVHVYDGLLCELNDSIVMKGDVVSVVYYGEHLGYCVVDTVGNLSIISNGHSVNNDSPNTSADHKNIDPSEDINGMNTVGNLSIISNGHSVNNDSPNTSVDHKDIDPSEDINGIDSMFKALSVDVSAESAMSQSNVFTYNVLMGSTQILLKTSNGLNCEKLSKNSEKRKLVKIGGMDTQFQLLREVVEFPFTHPSLYTRCGVYTAKGIIVHGINGTGKTSLVHGFLETLPKVFTATINGPELTSKFQGETEQKFRDVFEKTRLQAPAVLVIDEFDAICPSRAISSSDSEKRVIATLLTLMDSIGETELFVVIAITSKLDQIDMALRRQGRFDTEIEISVPNSSQRCDIMKKLLIGCKHNLRDEDIISLSEITHGYVGSDLSALVKEAGLIAMKDKVNELCCQPNSDEQYTDVDNLVESFSITLENFRSAVCNIRVNAMKAVTVDIPKVYWSDIGGQQAVKQRMKEAIEWPLKHPDVFKRLGIKPPRGLLMYGPPGCSKTLTAKALATESGLNFISIKGPELFNKYLGESEKAIRDVFHKARVSAPSIVFFDEIDAVGVQRSNKDASGNNVADRVLAQLLTELDGVESLDGVIIIAATNRPDIIDPALLRPGRIDHLVYVPLPDDVTRREIFQIQFRAIPTSHDVELDTLVTLSAGYSGAEICSLCREAAMSSLRANFDCNEVSFQHFQNVFMHTKPAVSTETVSFYDNFKKRTTGSL